MWYIFIFLSLFSALLTWVLCKNNASISRREEQEELDILITEYKAKHDIS